MIIEDYTPVRLETKKGQATPPVYEGKFVHVVGPEDEFLLLCPTALCKYHSHIVARFCSRRDDVSFVQSGDEGRFATPGWAARGGGRFRLDRAAHLLHIWGSSKAYGAFNGEAIREKVRGTRGWEGYEVRLAEPA